MTALIFIQFLDIFGGLNQSQPSLFTHQSTGKWSLMIKIQFGVFVTLTLQGPVLVLPPTIRVQPQNEVTWVGCPTDNRNGLIVGAQNTPLSFKISAMLSDHKLCTNLGSLHTGAKSCDHESVRAFKKVSKGHPKTPPKSCSVVTDHQVQCEVTCD